MKPMHHHIRILNRLRWGFGTAVLLGIIIPQLAVANPLGPQVVSGQATFTTQGKTLSVTNSDRAIINWQDFSIANGELTRFIQPAATSAVLNRVIGNNPSAIYGALQSNGRVYLVNQNGIFMGPTATIDVNGLVASTLNITDGDFKAGRINFNSGPLAGKIENQGAIRTPAGGSIYLIAPDVTNSGIINAPNGDILLAAGQQVSLVESTTPEIAVVVSAPGNQALNLGRIIAEAGRIGIYGGLIQHRGIVSANSAVVDKTGAVYFRATNDITLDKDSRTTANGPKGGSVTIRSDEGTTLVSGVVEAKGSSDKGGTVQLLGQRVGVIDAAQIDASGGLVGGTVLVGGDYQGKNPTVENADATYFGADASIKADAVTNGDGGKVILWGNEATRAYGRISARGGILSGDGGFVETSGKYLDYRGFADLQAPRGKAGTLLLDPTNIYIAIDLAAANLAGMSGSDSTANSGTGPIFSASGAVSDSLLTTGVLESSLSAANITVSTANASGTGAGDIHVVSPVTWGSPPFYSLTLTANNAINLNASLTSDTDIGIVGAIKLTAGSGGITSSAAGIITAASLEIRSSGSVNLPYGNVFNTVAANITNGNLNLNNAGSFSIDTVGGTNGITASGNVTLSAAGPVTQFQPITAAGLELLGGPYTLDHTLNSIGTLAGNVSQLSLTNKDTLTLSIGTVNTVGLTSGSDVVLNVGTITQTEGITAPSLSTTSNGQQLLTNSANSVDTFNATNNGTTGAISLVNTTAIAPLQIYGITQNATSSNGISINNTGNIQIAGNISTSTSNGVVTINTAVGNSIGQDSTFNITAAGLKMVGGGAYTLNESNNIGTLAGSVSSLELRNSGNLSIGTVNGTTGLSSLYYVNLDVGGTITQTQKIEITDPNPLNARLLETISVGGQTLTNAANSVGTFNASNTGTGNISFKNNNAAALLVSGISQAAGGTISIQNTGGGIEVTGPISGGTIASLTAGGTIIETGIGKVTTLTLNADSAGGMTLLNSGNTLNNFTGHNTGSGDIELTNGLPLTIGGITNTGSGGVTVNNTDNIILNGNITASGGGVTLRTSGGGISQAVGTGITALSLTTETTDYQDLRGANGVGIFTATNSGTTGTINLVNTKPVLTVTDITQTATSNNGISIQNTGDISITGSITSSDAAPGSLVFRADSDANGVGNIIFGGGHVTMFGGSTASIYYNPPGSYAAPTDYSGNFTGVTPTAYMLVNNVTQLQNILNNLAGVYALGKDINAAATSGWNSGAGFVPLGNDNLANPPGNIFTGTFDGLGHTITSLFIYRPSTQYVGMFGGTSGGATNIIRNVGLANVNITGGFQTGGLVAHTGASVENCYTTGQVTSGSNNVGGMVGLSAGSVSNSYSTATVNGNIWVGGLVGTLYTGGSITNSYSTGAVNGSSSVGGLVGYNYGAGPIVSSYWDTQTSGRLTSDGGTGKTTANMKLQATFAGWDFVNTWSMAAGSYPNLKAVPEIIVPPPPPPPPPTCTGGQYWDGAACVCPSGQSLIGGICGTCPTGQQLVGNICQPIICPTGQQLVGNLCEPITCPTGQQLVGNLCEPITCPTGQQLVGNLCEPITCPTGQQLVGNTCQPITCPTGQQLVGNICQPIICPTGQQLVGNLCEPITCPTGQQLVGNLCEPITCPTGQQLVGNLCQPITCTMGQVLVGNFCVCPGGKVFAGAGCQCPAGTIDYAGVCKTPSIVPGTDTSTVIYFPVTEELTEPLQVLIKSIINAANPSLFKTSGSPGGGAGDDLKPKKNYCN